MASIKLQGAGGRSIEINTGLFINNDFVPAKNGETIDIENPANGKKLATVPAAQRADVDAAVAAAKAAFQTTWKQTIPESRGKLLSKLADLIERDADDFASLEAMDAGILVNDSKFLNNAVAVQTLRYFAGWADKIDGHFLHVPAGFAYTRREPLGVCGAIIPWNSPLMIAAWKLAPAIATGNTLVIKTPELAPLWGQKLAALIVEAGFPPGVINIICGEGKTAGKALAEHMEIRKIAFTGSTVVGREILKASATSNLKKVTLELGGKGPSIVFPDADIENALFWTTIGITANNGQICAAGSRIYVHSSIYESFIKAFSDRSAKAVHGDPLLPETTKGPLISAAAHKRVTEYIEKGKASGAKLLHGGQALNGNFVANTAFADVREQDTIMKEEVFGPVASIAPFTTESEVIDKANATEYGLASAIFTNDVNRAHRVAAAIESGMVTVNSWAMLNANTPFGGVKQSGFGRDMGQDALEGWTTVKTVKFNLLPLKE